MKTYLCECTVRVGEAVTRHRVICNASDRTDALSKFTAYYGSGSHITLFITEVNSIG